MSPTVTWTETIRPVQIEQCRGARLLNEGTIPLWLKASDTDILGVIVDADGDCMARWNRISQLAKQYVPALPRAIPESGLVITTARSTVFGVWIMPDNKSVGMLETFLQALVPEKHRDLLEFAKHSAQEAKSHGAEYTEEQTPKAVVHGWLSWMNPPGKPFGIAFQERFFDANASAAGAFQCWFRKLYDL